MKEVDHRFATTGWLRFTWPILRLLPVGRCRPTLVRLLRHRHCHYYRDACADFWRWCVGLSGLLPMFCSASAWNDRTVLSRYVCNKAATRRSIGHYSPSPIRAIVSLAEWPHETMVHIFSHVLATRKGLPGARFAERQGLDCRCWWCSACALGFSISILWIQSCEENILDHPHPLPSIHRDAAASSSMYSIPTIR
jgi:hypothetical protein